MPDQQMIDRLNDEADLCANEGADDIAKLLREAAAAIDALQAAASQREGEVPADAKIDDRAWSGGLIDRSGACGFIAGTDLRPHLRSLVRALTAPATSIKAQAGDVGSDAWIEAALAPALGEDPVDDYYRIIVRAALSALQPPAEVAGCHPIQPLVIDEHGVTRFRANKLVQHLYDWAVPRGMGMNEMALKGFAPEEWQQFAQLIGYSLSGWGTLSYVDDEIWDRACAPTPPAMKEDSNE